jgi:hypothetical protein
LADHLQKSISEVMDFTTIELKTWAAYFELKGEKNGN